MRGSETPVINRYILHFASDIYEGFCTSIVRVVGNPAQVKSGMLSTQDNHCPSLCTELSIPQVIRSGSALYFLVDRHDLRPNLNNWSERR